MTDTKIHVPIPAGDNNQEVGFLRKQRTEETPEWAMHAATEIYDQHVDIEWVSAKATIISIAEIIIRFAPEEKAEAK